MGVIMFVATEKLKTNVYELEKEKIEDFAREIEYLIKGDFKILFYTYGDNKERYESAANASKDQLLNKIKEVTAKRKNRFAVVIKEGGREILKENLATIKNSDTITTKREFRPFKWEIEVYMDLTGMNKTIRENNNIVSLVIIFMTLANIAALFTYHYLQIIFI